MCGLKGGPHRTLAPDGKFHSPVVRLLPLVEQLIPHQRRLRFPGALITRVANGLFLSKISEAPRPE